MTTTTTTKNDVIFELLKNETSNLKSLLIERTIAYANNSFSLLVEQLPKLNEQYNQLSEEWMNAYKEKNKNNQYALSCELFKLGKKRTLVYDAVSKGLEKYIAKAVKNAESHYINSLIKLTNKIEEKNINMDNFKLVSGYVGCNLNITMTDGNKTINAWTIWAAENSEIVTPHYRYLVK